MSDMQMKYAGILGMGFYVPEKVLTNYDLEKMVETSHDWIVERTGIKERHIAAPEQATSDQALIAARKALEDAGIEAEQLDCIIVATETPDTKFPSTACVLQDLLGAKAAAAFDLSAGCSGFVYSLSVANSMISSGLYKHILIVGAETLSRIMNWKDRNTCVLFGDGAGAAVVGEVPEGYGILSVEMGADGSGGKFLQMPAGGSRKPASHETVDNNEHYIFMDGSEVFKFAVKIMASASKKVMDKAGISSEEVDLIIPHQANTRIISASAKRLHVPEEKVFVNVDRYGNTSAASVPIALCEARQQGLVKKDDKIVLVGFGAGLTWAAVAMKWWSK